MNTIEQTKEASIDLATLHLEKGRWMRANLYRKCGVPAQHVEDVYQSAMLQVLEKGDSEFDAERASAFTYVNLKVWSESTSFHKRQNRRGECEIDMSSVDRFSESNNDSMDTRRDERIQNLSSESCDKEDTVAAQEFVAALVEELNSRESELIEIVGFENLDMTPAEREEAGQAMGVSSATILRTLNSIRDKARKLWPDYFDSEPPKSMRD